MQEEYCVHAGGDRCSPHRFHSHHYDCVFLVGVRFLRRAQVGCCAENDTKAVVGYTATWVTFKAELKALEASVAVNKAPLLVQSAIGALQYHTHENIPHFSRLLWSALVAALY